MRACGCAQAIRIGHRRVSAGMKTAKRMKKGELPEKVCAACRRPFSWRRKWARDWDEVRYCSERCRRERGDRSQAG